MIQVNTCRLAISYSIYSLKLVQGRETIQPLCPTQALITCADSSTMSTTCSMQRQGAGKVLVSPQQKRRLSHQGVKTKADNCHFLLGYYDKLSITEIIAFIIGLVLLTFISTSIFRVPVKFDFYR